MSQPESPAETSGKARGPVPWNFYGRRSGKTLRGAQRVALAEDLDALRLPGVDGPGGRAALMAWVAGRPLWIEVGFGGGEHLAAVAAANPGVALVGVEPFVNGVAMFLRRLRALPVANVAIHPGDIRAVFPVLPDAAVSRVFLNYPDPWPKTRHHRRRFVTPQYLMPLARVMAPGGLLHIATDIASYARQARIEVPRAGFAPVADGPEPWAGWVTTRYEGKALRAGRAPEYLVYRRL
ncbi:MAG: tRNA (guanine(46)-N(7))-methyltransferase TrmB [Gemmobacter sp.]